MKTRIPKIIAAVAAALCLGGCGMTEIVGNHDLLGLEYDFQYAMLKLPNGQVYAGEVQSWYRSDATDRIRVTIDGISYVTQYSNVVLFSEKPEWLEEAE